MDAAAREMLAHPVELLDGGDLEGVARLFTHATVRSDGRPEVRRGSAQVLDLYRRMVQLSLLPGVRLPAHVTSSLVEFFLLGGDIITISPYCRSNAACTCSIVIPESSRASTVRCIAGEVAHVKSVVRQV